MTLGTSGPSVGAYGLLDAVVVKLSLLTTVIAGGAAFTLMVLGTVDVLGVQLLGRSLPSAIELQETFAGALIFTALAAAAHYRAHIAVDLVTGRLTGLASRIAEALSLICTLVVFAFLSVQACGMAAYSMRIRETSPGLLAFPIYPFKIVAFLGCAVASLAICRQLVRVLRGYAPEQSQFDTNELAP